MLHYIKTVAQWTLLATSAATQVLDCSRPRYTVQAGDTCDSVSAAQHVSTFQLTYVNAGISPGCRYLQPGQELCLGVTGQDCTVTTVVQSGDICHKVAYYANITVDLLLHNNPNINNECTNIYPGEVLCTSKETFNYTT